MTPKEKADNLFFEMAQNQVWHRNDTSVEDQRNRAIKCALVIVDEIESALTEYGAMSGELQNMDSEWRFWQSVTNELNKLKP